MNPLHCLAAVLLPATMTVGRARSRTLSNMIPTFGAVRCACSDLNALCGSRLGRGSNPKYAVKGSKAFLLKRRINLPSPAVFCKSEKSGECDKDSTVELSMPVSCHLRLRNATLADLDLLRKWDSQEHIQRSIGDYDFNDWNWEYELPRKHLPWRHQLIAELVEESMNQTHRVTTVRSIGFIQVIDPAEEETHYWGQDCPHNLRALDIWIGEPDCLGRGYGTIMMRTALQDYCFCDCSVEAALVDPLAENEAAHRFYKRLGFVPDSDVRWFGPDMCLVHRLHRKNYLRMQEKWR